MSERGSAPLGSNSGTPEATKQDSAQRIVDELVVSRVVRATGFDDVADALRSARDEAEVVVPWGSGSMMGLGNIPSRADVALDLTGLNKVVSYEPDDLTISAQAGCRIGELNRLLSEHGQMLPFDAAYPDAATIGGLYSTAVSGPRRFGYGSMRDLVIGITSVSTDGEISHGGGMVVKNVSGYDMMRLHYGALGSLGVVVQLNFKVLPAPRAERTVIARTEQLDTAINAAMSVRTSPLMPTSMVLLNPTTTEDLELGPSAWTLLLRAEGPANSVDRQAERLIDVMGSGHGQSETIAEDESVAVWNLVNRLIGAPSPADLLRLRIGVAPSATGDTVRRLLSFSDHGLPAPSILADLGNGFVYASYSPQGDGPAALQSVWDGARELGNHATIMAAPVEMKRNVDVFGAESRSFRLMKALKHQFDPSGTLNRGRFIGHL